MNKYEYDAKKQMPGGEKKTEHPASWNQQRGNPH